MISKDFPSNEGWILGSWNRIYQNALFDCNKHLSVPVVAKQHGESQLTDMRYMTTV
jgi:hypothetical protein